jgi:prepilin-type N-terminal cleavage/methylation domain-containing protein
VAARRKGFSLVEMLIVVVILGIIVLLGFPRMQAGLVNNNVRAARTTFINMIAGARAAASQTNRSTWVKIESSRAVVLARPRLDGVKTGTTNADTIGPVQNLSSAYGVTLAATPADSFRFNPGFTTLGAGTTTFTISRSGHSDVVTVDGLGRVQK